MTIRATDHTTAKSGVPYARYETDEIAAAWESVRLAQDRVNRELNLLASRRTTAKRKEARLRSREKRLFALLETIRAERDAPPIEREPTPIPEPAPPELTALRLTICRVMDWRHDDQPFLLARALDYIEDLERQLRAEMRVRGEQRTEDAA